ncbi:MAG: HEAT repeat domain-containing protein [Myxococcota bacterium]
MVRSLLALTLLAGCPAAAVDIPDPGAVVTDPTLQRMIGALADEHREGFGPAIAWLIAHPELARPALRAEVLARPDHLATSRGLVALARIGALEDVATMAAVLHAAQTDSGVWAAAAALGDHPHAEATLLAAAADPSDPIAGAAASVLGEHHVEAARPVLEALLTRADAGTRYRAVRAIGALGVGASRAALAAARKAERDPDVLAALGELGIR